MPESEVGSMLSLNQVAAGYYKKQVIRSIGFDVAEGDIIAILGANGSGKSTLLRAIMGLLGQVEGEIRFMGENITGHSPRTIVRCGITYLLQDKNMFPDLSVADNLALAGYGSLATIDFRHEIISLFPKLEELMPKRVGLLSGGERQMLGIAMAFMRKPRLALLDEPSAGLSPQLVKRVMDIIKGVNSRHGVTFLIVEQNIKAVLEIASRVFIMKNGILKENHAFANLLLQDNLKEVFFS